MTRRRGRRVPTAALALALAAALPLAAATWYESYHRAEEALAAEEWSEAVRHLNAALGERPRSGAKERTYGMRFIDYFPFLDLGIAYYHLGQVEAALDAFDTETRQGEIAKVPAALAKLERYRARIEGERRDERAELERRAAEIAAAELAAAERLEAEGRSEEALEALARVLAVDPDNPRAGEAQRRLLAAADEAERRRQARARRATLVEAGRSELDRGDHRAAAASFSEALEIEGSAEVEALLAEAQRSLRLELESRADRTRTIAGSLERAEALERSGDLVAALAELQTVLALETDHRRGRALERRLLAGQAAAEEDARAATDVRRLLDSAERLLDEGDYTLALRAANRVLLLEPSNPAALEQITRAYARLSDRLLRPDTAPPVILLDEAAGDGTAAAERRVRTPRLVVTGAVFDGSPVELLFLDAGRPAGSATVQRRELEGVWITDFRWEHDVEPGPSRFEIAAVDEEGNRGAIDYAVDYDVPFVRSAWLPAALGGGALLVAAALYGLRLRRRRGLLRDRFNPYVAGAPILEQTRFFGRRQLLDYVLRRITNNSIMLYGERRIGKTSFQHQLKRHLAALDDPDHEFFPVYVDLQGTPERRFFATLASEVFHELAPRLAGLEPEVPLDDPGYGYRQFVRDVQRVLKRLEGRTSKRVKLTLLIDEVDELNHYDSRTNQRLRSLFMRAFSDRLVAVVSGVSIKKQWDREGSPWYNFFQEIEVAPLDPEEARSLIEAPVRGIFAFADGAADEIIRRTASKPYLIQRICTGLVDRMHEDRRRTITLTDVDAACRVAGL